MTTLKSINTELGKIPIFREDKINTNLKETVYGLFCPVETLQIILRNKLNPTLERQTLLHEIMHSIEEYHGMTFKERDIDCIAYSLLYIIRNNPKLVEWIQNEE